MADYIDRTALLAELALNDYPWSDLDDAYNAIQKMPAADVAPVVHGTWIKFEPANLFENLWDNRQYAFRCSVCGNDKVNGRYIRVKTDFCPHCGAMMDKEG